MSGVYKRKENRNRKGSPWSVWWIGEDGKRKTRRGFTDKVESERLAAHLEAEARKVLSGLVEPGERTRREAGLKPLSSHVADYQLELLARDDTTKHAKHTAGTIRRLLDDAAIATVAELAPDRIQAALGRLKVRRSARTCNHALAAVKAFVTWLHDAGRIKDVPRGLRKIAPYPEGLDRKRVRRALTDAEMEKLLAAAEQGGTMVASRPGRGRLPSAWITGPERAALYRLAMATGFRADELRTLTPERFSIEGDSPTVVALACYSKRGKSSGRDDVQPIRRKDADAIREFLEGKEPGRPFMAVPTRTADMLKVDLEAAGIPYRDASGAVLDFHSLRHSYITSLVRSGVNVKIVQKLARHSTITLTLDRYSHVDDGDVRGALEGDDS